MKKKIGLLMTLMLIMICAFALADVKIDKKNFPDENFRTCVLQFDTDDNGVLSSAEIKAVTEMDVGRKQITDLTGIEHFETLESLTCDYNEIKSLNVSKNRSLKKLECRYNQLAKLDVSKNTVLEYLSCDNNKLTALDISNNKALTYFSCHYNQIKKLDVSKNIALTSLFCSTNELTKLDISKNVALTAFDCMFNQLTTLDVSKNTKLEYLYCHHNQLTKLDTSNNLEISCLDCSDNQLTNLTLGNNKVLDDLFCARNQLKNLDVSKAKALQSFDCSGNQLKSLDLSKNTKLEYLLCNNNQLKELDVSKNKILNEFNCSSNRLTNLDISKNKALTSLWCYSNQLTKLDISHSPVILNMVKTNDPVEEKDHLRWSMKYTYDTYSWKYIYLEVDKDVTIATGEKTIADADIATIEDQTYTGEEIKPTITVKYKGKKLKKDKDYTVSYQNNIEIGTATVVIKGKGAYTGSKEVTFLIVPQAVKLSSLTGGKKLLKVEWEKGDNITGYRIEYSLKKDFSNSKKITINRPGASKRTIKQLESGQTYYVRICTYKIVNGQSCFSAWSDVLKAKTK